MANWRQMMRASLIRSGALLGAAALGLFALFYGLAVLSYSAADAAFNSAAADVQHNWMGQGGAYVSDAMLFVFGVCPTSVAGCATAPVEAAIGLVPYRNAVDRVWHGLLAT